MSYVLPAGKLFRPFLKRGITWYEVKAGKDVFLGEPTRVIGDFKLEFEVGGIRILVEKEHVRAA